MEEAKVLEGEKALELGEVPTGEGHREELVELSDIKLVNEFTKDELQEYAITRLSTDLNLSKRVKLLRLEVINKIRERLKTGTDKKEPIVNNKSGLEKAKNHPEFIFNPANRRIFEWTEILGKRTDYVPCYVVDLLGNRL